MNSSATYHPLPLTRYSLTFILWVILTSFVTAACAPVTPPPPPANTPTRLPTDSPTPTLPPLPTPTPTPASARLVVWENLPPAQVQALAADITDFENTYPNYTVDVQHYDDPQTLIQAIAGETVEFHVGLGDASLVSALYAQDALQPLDEHFPGEFLEGFVSPALTGVTRDGQLWGLPDTVGMHLLLYYNRDVITAPPTSYTLWLSPLPMRTVGDWL
jgi:ABC-type glycerol-3-phosphate transport system substrate-binding protein